MYKSYLLKKGFETGKDNSGDKVTFIIQANIGIQGIDNSVVYTFLNNIESEYNKILTQAILNDIQTGREDHGK